MTQILNDDSVASRNNNSYDRHSHSGSGNANDDVELEAITSDVIA